MAEDASIAIRIILKERKQGWRWTSIVCARLPPSNNDSVIFLVRHSGLRR